MTEKQTKSLLNIYKELEKIFPHFVIIVCEKEQLGNEIQPDPNLFWSGGHVFAKHLINDAADKIARRKFNKVTPERLLKNNK